jgi:hypothetical protein
MACTPANTDVNGVNGMDPSYPTSHDCPPLLSAGIGAIPIGLQLDTGTISWTGRAANNPSSGSQTRVFCGYCRNPDTTGFESPFQQCWENGSLGPACAAPNDVCQQRNQGAFGPNGAGVKTITVVGTAAGSIVDGLPHAQTLASVFCIPPTGNAIADAGADLPGPAAIPLKGTRQLCSTADTCPDLGVLPSAARILPSCVIGSVGARILREPGGRSPRSVSLRTCSPRTHPDLATMPAVAADEPDELIRGQRAIAAVGEVHLEGTDGSTSDDDNKPIAGRRPRFTGSAEAVLYAPAGRRTGLGKSSARRMASREAVPSPILPRRPREVEHREAVARGRRGLITPFLGDVGIVSHGTDTKRYCTFRRNVAQERRSCSRRTRLRR